MLDRIKKLRAERQQILKDMSMIKSAFGIEEEATPPGGSCGNKPDGVEDPEDVSESASTPTGLGTDTIFGCFLFLNTVND